MTHAENKRDYRKTIFELHYGAWICTDNRVSVKHVRYYTLAERPEKMIIILYPPSEKEITAMICSLQSEEGDQQDEKHIVQEIEVEVTNECFYCGDVADFYPCEGCHQELCNDCMRIVACPCARSSNAEVMIESFSPNPEKDKSTTLKKTQKKESCEE